MNILVTGGAGFIGSNFIRYWLTQYPNDKVVNYDLLTYAGHLESLKDISENQNYSFIQGDICDSLMFEEAINSNNIDTIVHFAAESHVDRSISDPLSFVKTNVLGTQTILDIARKYSLRFHHVSTDEVFGSLELGTTKKFNEETKYSPNSPYAASKAGSDHLVNAYHNTYQLPITISNCSNNFGPYQDTEKFLPRMITNLIEGKNIYIYGDGKNVRDWLYVDDHCRAIDVILHQGKIGDCYLVGGLTEDIDNLSLAKLVLKIMNLTEEKIEYVKDRAGHDRRYAVDWSKINKELSWKPFEDFAKRLESTVKWYQENSWWWKPLKEKSELIYKNK